MHIYIISYSCFISINKNNDVNGFIGTVVKIKVEVNAS